MLDVTLNQLQGSPWRGKASMTTTGRPIPPWIGPGVLALDDDASTDDINSPCLRLVTTTQYTQQSTSCWKTYCTTLSNLNVWNVGAIERVTSGYRCGCLSETFRELTVRTVILIGYSMILRRLVKWLLLLHSKYTVICDRVITEANIQLRPLPNSNFKIFCSSLDWWAETFTLTICRTNNWADTLC